MIIIVSVKNKKKKTQQNKYNAKPNYKNFQDYTILQHTEFNCDKKTHINVKKTKQNKTNYMTIYLQFPFILIFFKMCKEVADYNPAPTRAL